MEPSSKLKNTAFSILELAPIREGLPIVHALEHAVTLAQHAEALNYRRLWLAEHHNIRGIASSATVVLISHLLANTKNIRIGSGGIMLPNHAPLVVAEQFGTLALLYPDRVELGLGRAPGTDPATMRALRRGRQETEEQFPRDVVEILSYFNEETPGQQIVAVPGQGTHVPVWLLGSSLFSAQLAAQLGLPYSFASHFAPRMMDHAIKRYRDMFRPSAYLDKPYVSIGVPAIVAETDEEAQYLATSTYQRIQALLTGKRMELKPPVASMEGRWTAAEKAGVMDFLAVAQVGSAATVKAGLETLLNRTQADEFIFTCDVYDTQKRLDSFMRLMQLREVSGV
jgi:luciferase family oxidoreductase group 1